MELNDKTVIKHATYFFSCLILLLFTCQFQQIHTGNGLVPARHHCRNDLRLDPRDHMGQRSNLRRNIVGTEPKVIKF